MSTLLQPAPCPWCGAQNIEIRDGSTFRWLVAECRECGATCGEVRVQTMGDGSQAEWQARAIWDALAEWEKRS